MQFLYHSSILCLHLQPVCHFREERPIKNSQKFSNIKGKLTIKQNCIITVILRNIPKVNHTDLTLIIISNNVTLLCFITIFRYYKTHCSLKIFHFVCRYLTLVSVFTSSGDHYLIKLCFLHIYSRTNISIPKIDFIYHIFYIECTSNIQTMSLAYLKFERHIP